MAESIKIDINVADNGTINKANKDAQELKNTLKGAAAAAESIRVPNATAAAREGVARSQAARSQAASSSQSTSQSTSQPKSAAYKAASGPGNTASDTNLSRGIGAQTGASGRDFAAQAQGLGGLVHVYATFAANLYAVSAAYSALSKAVDTANIVKGLDQIGAASGRSLGGLSKAMVTATQGAISLREAMTSTALATAGGMTSDQILRMTEVAKKASQALGRDLPDSMDRLTKGIVKTQPELLDELGIMTRVIPAQQEYARKLGISADALTDFQKKQAFANAVIAEGERKYGEIKLDVNPYSQLSASLSNIAQVGLGIVNNVLAPIAKVLADSPKGLTIVLTGIAALLLKQAIPALGHFRDGLEKLKMQNVAKATQLNAIIKEAGHDYDWEVVGKKAKEEYLVKSKYATASANEQKSILEEANKRADDAAQKAQQRATGLFGHETVNKRILDNLYKESAQTQIKYDVSRTQSAYGMVAAYNKLNEQIALSKSGKLQIQTGVDANGVAIMEKMGVKTGSLTNGMTRAIGVASIFASTIMTLMEAFSGFMIVLTIIGAGIAMLVDHFRVAKVESEKLSTSMDMVEEATKSAAKTIDLINSKPFLEQISVASLQARANAVDELSSSLIKMSKDYNALQAKMGEKSLFNPDFFDDLRVGNLLYQSFIGVWYKGAAVFDNTNTMLSESARKMSVNLIAAITETYDLTKGTQFEAQTRKNLEKIFGSAVAGFKDVEDLRKKLGEIPDALIDKAPAYLKLFKDTSDGLNKIASKATEAKGALDQMNKSFDAVMNTLALSDPLGKLGEDTLKSSQKLAEAFKDPMSSLAAFGDLLKDTNSLRMLPADLQKDLLNAKEGFEKDTKAVDELNKKLKELQQTEDDAREKLTGLSKIKTGYLREEPGESFGMSPVRRKATTSTPYDLDNLYGGTSTSTSTSSKSLTVNTEVAEKQLKAAEENRKDTERRINLLKSQGSYDNLMLRAQAAFLDKSIELINVSLGNQAKKTAIEIQQGLASNLTETASGIRLQGELQKELIDVEIANIKATLKLAQGADTLQKAIELNTLQQKRVNDKRDFEEGKTTSREATDKLISNSTNLKALDLATNDIRYKSLEGVQKIIKDYNLQQQNKITSKDAGIAQAQGKKVPNFVTAAEILAANRQLEILTKTAKGQGDIANLMGKKSNIDVGIEKAVFELGAKNANQLLDLDIKRNGILSSQLDSISSRSEYQSKELLMAKEIVENEVASLNLQKEENLIRGQIQDAESRRKTAGALSDVGVQQTEQIKKLTNDIANKSQAYQIDRQIREQKYQDLQRAGRIAQFNFYKDMELNEVNIANIRLGLSKSYLSEYTDLFGPMQTRLDLQNLELTNSKLIYAEQEKYNDAQKELNKIKGEGAQSRSVTTTVPGIPGMPAIDNSAAIAALEKETSELETSYEKLMNQMMTSPKIWKPNTKQTQEIIIGVVNQHRKDIDSLKKQKEALLAQNRPETKATETQTTTETVISKGAVAGAEKVLALQGQQAQNISRMNAVTTKGAIDVVAINTKADQERENAIFARAKKERENALANAQYIISLRDIKNQAQLDQVEHAAAMGYISKESEAQQRAENALIAFNNRKQTQLNDLAKKQVDVTNDKVKLDEAVAKAEALRQTEANKLNKSLSTERRDAQLKLIDDRAKLDNEDPEAVAAKKAKLMDDYSKGLLEVAEEEKVLREKIAGVVTQTNKIAQDAQDREVGTATALLDKEEAKLRYVKDQAEEQNKVARLLKDQATAQQELENDNKLKLAGLDLEKQRIDNAKALNYISEEESIRLSEIQSLKRLDIQYSQDNLAIENELVIAKRAQLNIIEQIKAADQERAAFINSIGDGPDGIPTLPAPTKIAPDPQALDDINKQVKGLEKKSAGLKENLTISKLVTKEGVLQQQKILEQNRLLKDQANQLQSLEISNSVKNAQLDLDSQRLDNAKALNKVSEETYAIEKGAIALDKLAMQYQRDKTAAINEVNVALRAQAEIQKQIQDAKDFEKYNYSGATYNKAVPDQQAVEDADTAVALSQQKSSAVSSIYAKQKQQTEEGVKQSLELEKQNQLLKAQESLATNLTTLFGDLGTAMGDYLKATIESGKVQKDLVAQKEKEIELLNKRQGPEYDTGATEAYEKDKTAIEKKYAALSFAEDVKVTSLKAKSAKKFFDEKSGMYKLLNTIEKVSAAITVAMEVKKLAASIAASGPLVASKIPGIFASFMEQLGPFGMAAAGVALAAVGLSGQSAGSAKDPTYKTPDVEKKLEVAGTGRDYVGQDADKNDIYKSNGGGYSGDPTRMSTSIVDSINKLEEVAWEQLDFQKSDTLKALVDIRDNTEGFARFITASGMTSSGILTPINEKKEWGGIIGGGSSSANTTSAGINIKGSVSQMAAGNVSGTAFKNTRVQGSEQGLFGLYSNSWDYNQKSEEALAQSSDFSQFAAKQAQAFVRTVQTVTTDMGGSIETANNVLNQTLLDINVNTLGTTAKEQSEQLLAQYGIKLDIALKAALPNIAKLETIWQKGSESFTDFAIRVKTNVTNATFAFESIGKSFEAVPEISHSELATSTRPIMTMWGTMFGTVTETFTRVVIDQVGASKEELGLMLEKSFGDTSKMNDLTKKFASNYLTEAERLAPVKKAVNKQMESLGYGYVDTKEEFKNLVLGFKVTDQASADTYAALLKVGDAFATVYKEATSAELVAKSLTQIQKMYELQNRGDMARAITRQQELNAMDALSRPMQQYLYNLEDEIALKSKLQTSYDKLKGALTNTVNGLKNSIDALGNYKNSLQLGANSTLTPQEAYAAAKAQLDATAATAGQKLDSSATAEQIAARDKAAAGLPAAIDAFLAQSKTSFASGEQYQKDFSIVNAILDSTTGELTKQKTSAELQLTAAESSASSLSLIVSSSQTTADMLSEYVTTQKSYIDATVKTDSSKPKTLSNDIAKAITSIGGIDTTSVSSVADSRGFAIPGHAMGGIASGLSLVGERGPELADFKSPARIYPANQTSMLTDASGLLVEIKALREEVAKLREDQKEQTGQIIISNYDANKKNAEVVASTTESVAKMQDWKERSKVVIS